MPDNPGPSTGDRLKVLAMHTLPHHLLSSVMYTATRLRLEVWKNWQIRWFIRRYGVDMNVALQPEPRAYAEFNSFFTRALKPGARPICEGESTLACPADGALSQAGTVEKDTLLQVKGQTFSLSRLLGGDPDLSNRFDGGPYATIYLSPRDYHRVHMPLPGQLLRMIHVPGRLFSVNPASTLLISGLFARNERVVSLFDTPLGLMAVVLVGAVFVGSIEQVWCGALTPAPSGAPRATDFEGAEQPVRLAKGEEMGRFNMGSTVIFALANPAMKVAGDMQPGRPLVMGECLAAMSALG